MFAAVLLRLGLERISTGALIRFGFYAVAALLVVVFARAAWDLRYQAGFRDALHSVAQQNLAASAAARKLQTTVDQCFDKGGKWDVRSGACDLP